MTVVIVTDSSASMPVGLREECGILQVPLHILVDGADLRDGVDPIPDDIYRREGATTAGATPAELAATYREALHDSGGDGVVAVHISAALSGTFGIAERVAAEFGGRVRVVDSKSTAMGTGFVALSAFHAAIAGLGLDTVATAAEEATRRVYAYIVVHRLDNLRRSGRIGSAAAWLGTALSLKPLLHMDNGELVLAQRVRTASKATQTMIDRVCELVGDRPVTFAVHHVANPEGAAEVVAALDERLPSCEPAIMTDLGPALALHVGGGAVAVCVLFDD